MKRIDDYSVRADLPESLKRQNVQELAELWDKAQARLVGSNIQKVLVYPVIDKLPGELVDALAVQLHCDFYDKSLSLAARRQIVKTSIAWHRIKGTPAAVEMLTQAIFHESHTKEWFEYGGRPYFFRMVQDISDGTEDATKETIALLKKAIWMGKNVRSWLELLEFVCNMEDDEGANVGDDGEGDFGAWASLAGFHDPVPYGTSIPIFSRDGIHMGDRFRDCGLMLYDRKRQDMHAGGSGCGCSASVLNGYLLNEMRKGTWKRIVFAPTGALLSPTSSFQGESVPGICHAVCLDMEPS